MTPPAPAPASALPVSHEIARKGAASEAREREWGKEGAKTVGGTRHVMCGAEGRGIGGRALQMGQTRSPRGGPCSRLPRSQRSTHAG